VLLTTPGYAGGNDADPFLVDVKQPVPKFYEGRQVRDLTHGPPWVDAP
jgi:hypothetical protein